MTKQQNRRLPILLSIALLLLLWAFILPQNSQAQWTTNGNNINNSNPGNVGIGPATPNYPLQINRDSSGELWLLSVLDNTAKTWSPTVRDGILFEGRFTGQTTNWAVANINYGYTDSYANGGATLSFDLVNSGGGWSKVMTFKGNGNVGVGTATPAGRFEIVNTSGAHNPSSYFQITGTTADISNYPGISLKGGNLVNEYPYMLLGNGGLSLTVAGGRHSTSYPNRVQLTLSSNMSGYGYAGFQLFNGTTTTDLLMVKDNGNVGIGTATPRLRFEAKGVAGMPASSGTSQTGSMRLSQASGSLVMDFGLGGNPGFGWLQVVDSSNLSGNYGLLLNPNGGTVGIGTSSPNSSLKLDVAGQIRSSSGGFVFPDGTVQTSAATGGGGSSQWTTNGNDISNANSGNVGIGGPAVANFKLNVTGNLNVTNTITGGTIEAKYQDVAEWVISRQKLSAGTVVILDPERTNQVIASKESYDTRVAGVISEQPGVLLGEGGEGKVKVATTGRVRVKVDATGGSIKIGDLLVASSEEGVAMKSQPVNVGGVLFHRPGTIIGKALEPLEKGKSEILVLLSLQ